MEFVIVLRRPTGIAQSWGPFESEPAAETARDRFKSWPALDGEFEIVPMVRLIEPTPAVPAAPAPIPWQPVQPLPAIPNWPYQQPPVVWCDAVNPPPTTIARGVSYELDPRAVAQYQLGRDLGWLPSTITATFNGSVLSEVEIARIVRDSTRRTLGRIDEEIGDDEDPPAAVAAVPVS